jgi:lipoprotein-releasing system ATP-binding protein
MVIELLQITKNYGNNNPVLDNISFRIPEGSSLAITGPSGSGKSTLLNILGTLDYPTSGEIRFDGKAIRDFNENELIELRNKKIGFVFQTHVLLPQLTAFENILLPVIPRDKTHRKKAPERALQLLESVGLADKARQFPGEMSVGECQRVAVVRSLINQPELLLTDEPTGSLDHNSAETLSDMLVKLRKIHGFTLIAVTHSPYLANRMESAYKLLNGKILVD